MKDSVDTVSAPNIQGDAAKANTYDVIVIGSGMSGGWAVKEFCEKGLKTLVLERGRNVDCQSLAPDSVFVQPLQRANPIREWRPETKNSVDLDSCAAHR